jgi:hypothetical protein
MGRCSYQRNGSVLRIHDAAGSLRRGSAAGRIRMTSASGSSPKARARPSDRSPVAATQTRGARALPDELHHRRRFRSAGGEPLDARVRVGLGSDDDRTVRALLDPKTALAHGRHQGTKV